MYPLMLTLFRPHEIPQPFWQILRQVSRAGSIFLFLFSGCSEPRNWSPSIRLRVLRRRIGADLTVESSVESRDGNVGDALSVEVEETVDDVALFFLPFLFEKM